MISQKIPLGKPFIGKEEKKAVNEIIDSGNIATGDTVRVFEEEFAKKIGAKYCVMVNSGTVALYLALIASKVRGYVIIPALTCKSVLDAVLSAGLKPIFADIEPDTHNLDLSTVSEDVLTHASCVVVVHSYGHSADMDKLNYYIGKYNLFLIEDFAQSIGGYYKSKILGSFGNISITSFYGPKIMTTGHGGAILTDDTEIYRRCKCMVSCKSERTFITGALNYQMTDIGAAIGLEQLKKLDEIIAFRRSIAREYAGKLNHLDIDLPREKSYAKHVFYKYYILLPEKNKKEYFIERMDLEGIQTGILYDTPLHKAFSKVSSKYKYLKLPVAENIAYRIVSLPMYPALNKSEIDVICDTIINILGD